MTSTSLMLTPAGASPAPAIVQKPRAQAGRHPEIAADNPDVFLVPVLECFPLARRAVLLATGGALGLDLCAFLAQGLEPDGPGSAPDGRAQAALWIGVGAWALVAAAAAALGSIQVRYTFEHAATRREHFYELKLARFHEACAELKSLAVKDAVGAVGALHALRKEIGGLDRRLVVETLILKRRLRNLLWGGRAIVVLAALGAIAALAATGRGGFLGVAVPLLVIALGLLLHFGLDLWTRERMGRVVELLAAAPPEVAQAFDPAPPLEAAIERLLTRVNRHFDRLKGAPDFRDEDGENAT